MATKNSSSTSQKEDSFLGDYAESVLGAAGDQAVTETASSLMGDTVSIIASRIGGTKGKVAAAAISAVSEAFVGAAVQESREAALNEDGITVSELVEDFAVGSASSAVAAATLGLLGVGGLPLVAGSLLVGALLETIAGTLDEGGPRSVVESYAHNQAEQDSAVETHQNQELENNVPNPHDSVDADSRTPGQIALEEGNPMDNPLVRRALESYEQDRANPDGTPGPGGTPNPDGTPDPGGTPDPDGTPSPDGTQGSERAPGAGEPNGEPESNGQSEQGSGNGTGSSGQGSHGDQPTPNQEPSNGDGERGEADPYQGNAVGNCPEDTICFVDPQEIKGNVSEQNMPNPANEDQGDPDANSDSPLKDVDADIDYGAEHEEGGDPITGYELLMEWNGKIDGDPIGELQQDADAIGRFDWLVKIDPFTNWGPDGNQSNDPVNNDIIEHIQGINPRFMDSLSAMMDSKDLGSAVIGVDFHSDDQLLIAAFADI